MSKDWYLLNKPPLYNSGFEADEHFDYFIDEFSETLLTTALGVDVVLYKNGELDDSTALYTKAVVQNNTTDSPNQDNLRQILCETGNIKKGNYVKYNGRIYLITGQPDNNRIYEKAIMICCNHLLKWVNCDGEMVAYHGVVSDGTRWSPGTSENKFLVLGDVQMVVSLPRNKEVLRIERDMRFIISNNFEAAHPNTFKVTKVDDVSDYTDADNAIVSVTFLEDSFSDMRDSKELLIANTVKTVDNEEKYMQDSPHNSPIISYSGDAVLRIGGTAKRFTASFSENDIAVWNVFEHGSDVIPPYITVVSQDAVSIGLSCVNDRKLDGRIICLKLSGKNSSEVDVVEIELISLT